MGENPLQGEAGPAGEALWLLALARDALARGDAGEAARLLADVELAVRALGDTEDKGGG